MIYCVVLKVDYHLHWYSFILACRVTHFLSFFIHFRGFVIACPLNLHCVFLILSWNTTDNMAIVSSEVLLDHVRRHRPQAYGDAPQVRRHRP